MASAEWGPRGVHLEQGNLREVTRFSGNQLREIAERAKPYFKDHPGSKRPVLFPEIAKSETQEEFYKKQELEERFQAGLDILNQLGVVERGAADVESVL